MFVCLLNLIIIFTEFFRLTKSAGVCVQRKIRINQTEEQRISKIELSSKVIDSAGIYLSINYTEFFKKN